MWTLALLALSCGPSRTPQGFVRTDPHPTVGEKNLLLVLLDDVSADRVSPYGGPARMPTLDGLASQGVRLDQAYAYATCSPTRSALLTGRYTRRTGIGFNVKSDATSGLPHDETLVPELLRDAARPWTSAGIGKWHLTPHEERSVADPRAQGFASFEGPLGNLLVPETYTDYTWYTSDGRIEPHQTAYLTTREVDAALAHVARLPEPWFLYLSLHAPHAPFHAPPEALVTIPVAPDAPIADRYDAMLEAADHELGRLLDAVDLTDTVVMVLGDNGTPRKAVRPPRRPGQGKNSFWEGGIRVPWIVAGPGIPAGQRRDGFVSVVDVYPTVAAMAGLRPERTEAPLDGRSLWPLVLEGDRTGRDELFVERYDPAHPKSSWTVLRHGALKLVRDGEEGTMVFDMRHGPEGRRLPSAEAAGPLLSRLESLEASLARDPKQTMRVNSSK